MLAMRLNITDVEFVPGKLLTKQYPMFADEFAKYIANVMRYEIVKAIDTQRYAKTWAPLTFNYIKYKKLHNLSLHIWEANGLLKNSITARKRNGYYSIGISESLRYKNGVKIHDVARWMEYGTPRMPARPLFRPVISYIRKNISRYWKKFLLDEKGIKI